MINDYTDTEKKMIVELLMIFPIYAGIFVMFYRFRYIMKVMVEANNILFDVFSDISEVNMNR